MASYSWAEIGGVLLHGAPHTPEQGFAGLMLSKLTGWRGLSGARGSSDPIPGGHGTYAASEVLRSERSMALSGAAIGVDAAHASVLLEQLESALADRVVLLRVCDDTGVWSRMVEVEVFQPAEGWNRPRVPFTIDLIAPDPARYRDPVVLGPVGVPELVGGLYLPAEMPWDLGTSTRPASRLVNDGKVPVLPVVTVQGAASAIVVHGGPRRIEHGPFEGVLVVDSLQRRAWVNGGEVTRQLLRRDWHQVPPGDSQDFYFTGTGMDPSTELTVEYQIGVR